MSGKGLGKWEWRKIRGRKASPAFSREVESQKFSDKITSLKPIVKSLLSKII